MRGMPPPTGKDWRQWAERLQDWFGRAADKLTFKRGDETPSDNGILMWDRETDHAVVSLDGVFKPLSYGYNYYGAFLDTTDQTAAAINTAYAITWNTTASSNGISIGTPTSRIVFSQAGRFLIHFTVQLSSASSSAKNVYFWPKVNGTDVPGSTIKYTIDINNGTRVISRSAVFDVSANDYLEAYWATDDTDVTLESIAATGFAPYSPSVTLMITEVNGV